MVEPIKPFPVRQTDTGRWQTARRCDAGHRSRWWGWPQPGRPAGTVARHGQAHGQRSRPKARGGRGSEDITWCYGRRVSGGGRQVVVICPARWLCGSGARLSFVGLMTVPTLRPALRDQLCVVLFGHPWQLSNESNCRPKLVVVVIAPGRHAGHFDPMFDDPE